MVEVKLLVLKGGAPFDVSVDDPHYVADPNHQYFLNYRPLPNYDDDIKVQINAKTFLKHVESTADDKTGDILVELAKAASAFASRENAAAPAGLPILNVTIDPTHPGEVRAAEWALNDRALSFSANQRQACVELQTTATALRGGLEEAELDAALAHSTAEARATADKKQYDDKFKALKSPLDRSAKAELLALARTMRESERNKVAAKAKLDKASKKFSDADVNAEDNGQDCRVYVAAHRRLLSGLVAACRTEWSNNSQQRQVCDRYRTEARKINLGYAQVPLYLRLDVEPSIIRIEATAPTPDCSIGICYRPKEVHTIVYWIGEGRRSKLVEVPNAAAIVAIDTRRTFLAKKFQKMTFDENDGSLKSVTINKESELLAAAKLPAEIVSAVADAIQIRAKVVTQKKSLSEQEAAVLKARSDYRDAAGITRERARAGDEPRENETSQTSQRKPPAYGNRPFVVEDPDAQ